MNGKIIAIAAVVVIIAAAAGATVFIGDDGEDVKKGGLYELNAKIIDVDMGGMSGTPKVIDTLEMMYHAVYGDFAEGTDKLTISDAKTDSEFWSKYCTYDHLAKVESDGTIRYHTVADEKMTLVEKTLPANGANKLIATGSAYAFTQYYMICAKYNVEPFSDEASKNSELLKEFQSLNYAGLMLDDIKTSSEKLASLYPADYKSRCGSIKTYDLEMIGQDVKDAGAGGNTVIVMGSGTINKKNNAQVLSTIENNGGYMLLNNAKSIPETFAMVEEIGIVLGYSEYVDEVIEGLELQLYKIYYSLQQHADEKHKAYFEGSSGKASGKTGSGYSLCGDFFGWDVSLFDGAEHDTENLLQEKPDIILFYTNDERSMDVKMRISSV